jgi:hypothetical protein
LAGKAHQSSVPQAALFVRLTVGFLLSEFSEPDFNEKKCIPVDSDRVNNEVTEDVAIKGHSPTDNYFKTEVIVKLSHVVAYRPYTWLRT